MSDGMSRRRGREVKEWKVLRLPFLLPPDAALGNAGALAELCAAADPGRGPHPRRAPLLPALPGGRGQPHAGESGAVRALIFLLWLLFVPLKKTNGNNPKSLSFNISNVD